MQFVNVYVVLFCHETHMLILGLVTVRMRNLITLCLEWHYVIHNGCCWIPDITLFVSVLPLLMDTLHKNESYIMFYCTL